MSLQMKGRKPFLVELLTFSESFKAYHIIKIELKSLFRLLSPVKQTRGKKRSDGNELHDVKIKV